MNARIRLHTVAACLTVLLVLDFGCSEPDGTHSPSNSGKDDASQMNAAKGASSGAAKKTQDAKKQDAKKQDAEKQDAEKQDTEKSGVEAPATLALDESSTAPAAGKAEESPGAARTGSAHPEKRRDGAPAATAGDAQELSTVCAALLKRIQEYDKATPYEFYDLRRGADEIDRDIIKCIQECEAFLKECGTGAKTCYVKSVAARMLMVRTDRYRDALRRQKLPAEELKTKFHEYLERTSELAKDVLACRLESKRPRNEALHVLAGTAEKARDYLGMRKYSKQILEEFPNDSRAGTLRFKVGRSYIWRGEYKQAAKYFRGVVDKHFEDQEYVIYNIGLHEALHGSGDMKGMEQLMHTIKADYPTRMEKIEKKYIRAQAFQWIHIADFWIGCARLALGDPNGAIEAFQRHVSTVADLKARFEAEKKKLDPVIGIFENFRTQPMLAFVTERYGTIPKIDLEEVNWVTPEKVLLSELRGNVVIAMFRRPMDSRSAGFFKFVGDLVKENHAKGLRAFSLGFVLGKEDPAADARRADKALEELRRGEINIPVGFDPDRKRQSIFRELGATVGTASCIIFNRHGEYAWTLSDPKEIHRETLRLVINRLLAE